VKIEVYGEPKESQEAPVEFSHDNNHDGVTFKGWDWVSGNGLPYNHVFFGEWHALGTIGVERVFSF
jgi:hypothetical protein